LGGTASAGITSVDSAPLYAFGYGASYTSFEVGDLRVSDTEIPTDGEVEVTARVTNVGDRAGDEVVQLYLHDPVAQVARPARLLMGFSRVHLEPGAAADVVFSLHADRTAYTGPDLERLVEPGEIRLLVGTSAADERGRASVRLSGPPRIVGHGRRLDTPTRVLPVPAD
jgi:beta-glucosidase